MTQQIVIGVDGSETSVDALAAAADLAEQTGSQLSIVFVRDPGLARVAATYEPVAESAIEQSVAELEATARERTFDALRDKHVAWTFDAATGDVVHELVNVAQRRHAPVIVVGGRRHSAIGGVVVGSVAQKLVRASPVSVLVVRQPEPDRVAAI